jgi:hypothetical protein
VEALNDFFCGIAGRFEKLLLQIRSETGIYALEASHPDDGVYATPLKSGVGESFLTGGQSGQEDDYEIKRDEFGRQEWNHFQMGLRLLSSVLVVLRKVEQEWDGSVDLLLKKVEPFVSTSSSSSVGGPSMEVEDHKEDTGRLRYCEASLLSLRLSSLNSVHLSQWISKAHSPSPSSTTPSKYFQPSVQHLQGLLKKCQKYLFDTMILPIDKRLSLLSSLQVWTLKSAPNPSPFQLEMPQFSLSPSEYVTRIGEHLLSLPQQLDLYVDDPGLGVGLEGLPFLEPLLGTSLFGGCVGGNNREEEEGEIRGTDGEGLGEAQEEEEEALDITYIWMTSVSRGTMSLLYEKILDLKTLTQHGCSQLLTDLQYLVNVLSAMDIEPTEEYKALMMVLEKDPSELKALLEGKQEEEGGFLNREWFTKHASLVHKVVFMRGCL